MCRKCIKSLIKQVKQFTAGTVKCVRITVKPVQRKDKTIFKAGGEKKYDRAIKLQKGKTVSKKLRHFS